MPGFGNILRNNGLVFRGTQWNAQHEIYEKAFVIFRTEKLQWLLALKVAGVLLHCNTCGGLFSSRTKCAVLALVWHHTTPTLCSIEDMSKVPKSMQWPRTQLWKSLKQENSCSGNQVWTGNFCALPTTLFTPLGYIITTHHEVTLWDSIKLPGRTGTIWPTTSIQPNPVAFSEGLFRSYQHSPPVNFRSPAGIVINTMAAKKKKN